MALIERKGAASPRELRIFGALLAGFGSLIAALVLYRTGSWTAAGIIGGVTFLICAFYYAVPGVRPVVFSAWMGVFYPIGWLISHAMLAGIYYLVITPIALIGRLFGRDPLRLKRDSSASTYWVPLPGEEKTSRYFQQF